MREVIARALADYHHGFDGAKYVHLYYPDADAVIHALKTGGYTKGEFAAIS